MSKVFVVSGGMDSVAALHTQHAKDDTRDIVCSFYYGQRHGRELYYAGMHAEMLGLNHIVFDIQAIMKSFVEVGSQSSLINHDVDVPHGHYAAENMKSTVVPNRNMIMASVAAGLAVSSGADTLVLGVHSGDHAIYPDCRPEFINALEHTLKVGNEGFIMPTFEITTPWLNVSKTSIVEQFVAHHPVQLLGLTWSCYEGDTLHCGKCGTCVERKEAFTDAGVEDPTRYQTDVIA